MATLLILKRRMRTASNVSKTTKAFQMISASKLKKAQNAAESSKPYVEKLDSISKALERRVDKDNLHQYMMSQTNVKAKLLVVISPDKGLCGGLVTNLLREVLHYNNNEKTYYITVGKKRKGQWRHLIKRLLLLFLLALPYPNLKWSSLSQNWLTNIS